MSGFGLAGFGTGFIQGFDAMGSQFARRGLLQREAEQSRRQDRTLALEEELKRQEAVRQEREAISRNAQRDLETDVMRAKYPYVAKAAELSVKGQELGNTGQDLNNQVTQAKLPYVAPAAEAQVEGQKLENTGQGLQNQVTQAKMPYVAPAAAAQVKGQELDNATTEAKLPYVGQSAAAQVQGQQLDNQGKGYTNEVSKRTVDSAVSSSESDAAKKKEEVTRLQRTTENYVTTSDAATKEAQAAADAARVNADVTKATEADAIRAKKGVADTAVGQGQTALASGKYAEQDEVAKLNQTNANTASINAGTAGKQLDNAGKEFEVDAAKRKNAQRVRASQAMNNIKSGNYTAEDLDAISQLGPVAKLASNPELIGDARNIIGAVQEGAKAGGDVAAFNQPNVLDSLNRVFSDSVTRTRGMPLDKDGMLVAGDSRIVEMVRNPKDNLIGFTLEVRPEPNPQRKDLLQKALQNASTPQQRQAIEAELNPMPYRVALTDGRTPAAQGGQQRWFTPDEVKKAVMGVASVANLKERNPQVLQDLLDVHGKIERGEMGETDGKALDNEIKVRKENRENREEMRKIEGDSRTQKKEKRAERSDAFKEAASIIDKQYSTVDQLTGMASFQGDNGQKAADEKLMVDKVLRRNPNMSGAQALEKARRIMAKQGNNPAQSSAKAGVTGKKDFSALW